MNSIPCKQSWQFKLSGLMSSATELLQVYSNVLIALNPKPV